MPAWVFLLPWQIGGIPSEVGRDWMFRELSTIDAFHIRVDTHPPGQFTPFSTARKLNDLKLYVSPV